MLYPWNQYCVQSLLTSSLIIWMFVERQHYTGRRPDEPEVCAAMQIRMEKWPNRKLIKFNSEVQRVFQGKKEYSLTPAE